MLLFYSAKINNKSYRSDQLPWLPALFCQHISKFPVMLSLELESCFLLGSLLSLWDFFPELLASCFFEESDRMGNGTHCKTENGSTGK